MIARRPVKPSEQNFTLEEVKSLITGNFHMDEEDGQAGQSLLSNRAFRLAFSN